MTASPWGSVDQRCGRVYNGVMRWLSLVSVVGVLLLLACEGERTPAPQPMPPVTDTPAITPSEGATSTPAYSPVWSVDVVEMEDKRQVMVNDGRRRLVLATSPIDPEETLQRWDLRATADVDGDGQEEAIVLHYTGGAHCCFEYFVVATTPQGPVVLDSFSLGNASIEQVMDITADGRAELLTWDDRLAYFDALPYAFSPFLPLVLCWRDGAFQDCTARFPELLRAEANGAVDRLLSAVQEGGKDDLVKRGAALKVAALYHRMGQLREGLGKVANICPPCAEWLEENKQGLLDALSVEIPYRVR